MFLVDEFLKGLSK